MARRPRTAMVSRPMTKSWRGEDGSGLDAGETGGQLCFRDMKFIFDSSATKTRDLNAKDIYHGFEDSFGTRNPQETMVNPGKPCFFCHLWWFPSG